jgi:hypothetical protein
VELVTWQLLNDKHFCSKPLMAACPAQVSGGKLFL